jgi:hypothetical protein
MNDDFFEENWKPLVALALGVGVGVLIAKSLLDSDDDEHGFGPKDFACLKLPQTALEEYHEKKCVTLILDFSVNGSGKVLLKLKGYNANGKRKVKIPLHIERTGCHFSEGSLMGKFKHDESRTPLHDLIASDPKALRDWWLQPVECPLDPTLVSYILDDRSGDRSDKNSDISQSAQFAQSASLAAYRINPSPPG